MIRRTGHARCIRSVALGLAIGLSTACEGPQPTALESAPPPDVAFKVSDAPAQSGPVVARQVVPGDPFLFNGPVGSSDPAADLMAIHLPLEWDQCGGASPIDEFELQRITTPSSADKVIEQFRADETFVGVYATSDFSEPFGGDLAQLCAFLVGPKLLAHGVARMNWQVSWAGDCASDLTGFCGSAVERFSFKWGGQLTGVGGAETHYSEHQLCRFPGGGIVCSVEKIHLSGSGD